MLPDAEPPLPISAVYPALGSTCIITFSEALVPGSKQGSNWLGRKANVGRAGGAPCSVSSSVVTVNTTSTGANAGPNMITYAPGIADIKSAATGLFVAPFANFPATIL